MARGHGLCNDAYFKESLHRMTNSPHDAFMSSCVASYR